MKRSLLVSLAVLPALVFSASPVGTAFDSGARYATDAYPGFDDYEENTSPQRKKPRWFSFFTGPERSSPAEQMAYCRELLSEESWSEAADELDALVRNWPTAPEAAQAQLLLAETLERKVGDYEEAFREYRYLADFYSLHVDYDAVADSMYRVARVMRDEGKKIVFFRFDNTVDVRRAFEACVLRAPGARWAPQAMLAIASLREKDGRYTEAIKVYENLRSICRDGEESRIALVREADARMKVLEDFGYNRDRVGDTALFLERAAAGCEGEDKVKIESSLAFVRSLLEEEAYNSAKFYDSRMRTKRSAVSAYEDFLSRYPDGKRAEEVKKRLDELKRKENEK